MVGNAISATSEDNSLNEIIGRIVDVARPERIILFGSSTGGRRERIVTWICW